VPLIIIDTPFLYRGAEEHQIEYVRKQLEEMIPVAERIAGKELSWSKLRDFIQCSRDASDLWLEVMNRAQNRPSPITAFDTFVNMGPIVDLRGEPETVDFYHLLLKEIDDRISRGVGAIKNEQYRVLWDNLPIWYRIGKLSRLLGDRGVNVVCSTYTYAWGELAPMIQPDKPLESGARVYLHPILNRSTGDKLESMRRMMTDFHCQGAILHSDRSCKPYSLGQVDQRDRLVNELGAAALLLEADHNDPRSYADEQSNARLEAFVEMMESAAGVPA